MVYEQQLWEYHTMNVSQNLNHSETSYVCSFNIISYQYH